MPGSTISSTSAAITALPPNIEPPGPRPFRPGPRSPAWPLGHRRSCGRPSCALLRPEPIKLTVPIEACRPKGKTPPQDLRRTISAILWRYENGAKWRAIPADLGPWRRAAQMFIRWARLGVWERLLRLAQERGVQLGMTFL